MSHPLGEAHRDACGADVLAHSNVFEPFLLGIGFGATSLEKCIVKKSRYIVFGQEMSGECVKLFPRFSAFRPPVFEGLDPVFVVSGELCQSGQVRVVYIPTIAFAGPDGTQEVAVFFDMQNKTPQRLLGIGVVFETVVEGSDSSGDDGEGVVLEFAFEDAGNILGTSRVVAQMNVGVWLWVLAFEAVDFGLALFGGFVQVFVESVTVTPEFVGEYGIDSKGVEVML